eukprot:scaffold72664_cov35-Tisochrysis_lutea.AAC.3
MGACVLCALDAGAASKKLFTYCVTPSYVSVLSALRWIPQNLRRATGAETSLSQHRQRSTPGLPAVASSSIPTTTNDSLRYGSPVTH